MTDFSQGMIVVNVDKLSGPDAPAAAIEGGSYLVRTQGPSTTIPGQQIAEMIGG